MTALQELEKSIVEYPSKVIPFPEPDFREASEELILPDSRHTREEELLKSNREVMDRTLEAIREGFADQIREKVELKTQLETLSVRVEQIIKTFAGNGKGPLMDRIVSAEVTIINLGSQMKETRRELDQLEKDINAKRWWMLTMLVGSIISTMVAVLVASLK